MKFKVGDPVGKTRIMSIETRIIENSKGKHVEKTAWLQNFKRARIIREDEEGEYIWLSMVGKSEGIKTRPPERK